MNLNLIVLGFIFYFNIDSCFMYLDCFIFYCYNFDIVIIVWKMRIEEKVLIIVCL